MFAFLRAWGSALVLGDSLVSTAAKVGGILIVIIGAKVLEAPVQVAFWVPAWSFGAEREWTVGWILFVTAASAYVAWAGGMAWRNSRGPSLAVGETLIADTELDVFRLQVRNRGDGILEPRVTLLWLECNGVEDHASWMPLEMRWSLSGGGPPKLSWNEAANVDICKLQNRETYLETAVFLGSSPTAHVALRPLRGNYSVVDFCVRVTVPGTRRFVERAFRLDPDATAPLRFRPMRLVDRESSPGLSRVVRTVIRRPKGV